MEKKIAILHNGQLAHYNVKKEKNGHFIARLIKYSGHRDEPPAEIDLHKEGRHWEDEGAEQDLVDDIGHAIEHDKDAVQKPIFQQRDIDNRKDNNSEREDRKQGGRP